MKRRRKRSAKRARRSSAKQSYSILPYLILLLVVLGLVFALNKLYEARNAYAAFPGGPNSIGYIGCSNSANAVEGYHSSPNNGVLMWPPYQTGSQTISRWANPAARVWPRFDRQVKRYGQPILVWVQLCENEGEEQATYDMVKQALINLRAHAPTATFYISSLNSYDPITMCAGRNGPDYLYDVFAFRDQAVAEGYGLLGPDLGPLTPELAASDSCHPNEAGKLDPLGKQLVGFFDGLYVTPTPTP